LIIVIEFVEEEKSMGQVERIEVLSGQSNGFFSDQGA